LARLSSADSNLLSFAVGVGWWKFVGVVFAAVLLLLRCVCERGNQSITLAGSGVTVLCALIAGPLTWDHYLVWSIIPVMLLAARIQSWQYVFLLLILLPLYFAVPYPKPDEVAAHAVWRVLTMAQVMSITGVAVWLTALSRVDTVITEITE
jgi:hypothetical protein